MLQRKSSPGAVNTLGRNDASRLNSLSNVQHPPAHSSQPIDNRKSPPTSRALSETLKVVTSGLIADSRRSVYLSNDDLVSGQRVLLRQPDGLFAPGKLIAMKPPDVSVF